MLKDYFSLQKYLKDSRSSNYSAKDTAYAANSGASAVTIGAKTLGGTRGKGTTSGSTFDYLSTAENTIECYYQKLDDLRYYESHALTEKIVGLFRDYINQLWKEGSDIIDVPGEDPKLIKELNKELEHMDLIEVLTKDLNDVIFYGSVSYEISGIDAEDPKYKDKGEDDEDGKLDGNSVRNIYKTKDKPADRKYDLGPERSTSLSEKTSYYSEIEDKSGAEDRQYGRPNKQNARLDVESTSPKIKSIIEETSPASRRGIAEYEEYGNPNKKKLNAIRPKDGPVDVGDKLSEIRSKEVYTPKLKLNKLKHPHHTIIEYDKKEGRRYLVKANTKYHIPVNKHSIFYYGSDSMKIAEVDDIRRRFKFNQKSTVSDLVGHDEFMKAQKKEYEKLGIDPKDPKKKPTKYELQERELSAAVPLFYHHVPKIRELYLKDLVVSILGIKDVIQPDILAMNFEGGMDIDQAQEMCTDLEDLLNKNSDYSIFNSAALDYNDLVKLLVDTVRVLPDIEGKLQSLNPIRTTTLQEKIQQVRMEAKELERDIVSALGVPMDLFEGNSSKWEVIKRSERLQSRVNSYVNMLKGTIRRLAQSVFFQLYKRELKSTDFKVTLFNETDMEIAAKTNRLQSLNELSQTLIQVVVGAERELQESQLINKTAYYQKLQSSLKEIYPEIDDLIQIPEEGADQGQQEQQDQYGQDQYNQYQ